MTAALEAEGVFDPSRRRKTMLDAIDLRFAAGEMVAMVGPNGAGKSTLLRTLSGDLRPARGAIRLKDRDVAAYLPRLLAQRRAMLSQHVTVTFPFTVEEIVGMGAGDRGRARAQPLVECRARRSRPCALPAAASPTLSGGEQQRAHFARVLVQLGCGEEMHGPGVLLLDEPTASLDLRHQLALIAATQRRAARHGCHRGAA